jgi:elongation factor Ts
MSTTIPANLVKQLRDETGAGMMDCKRALEEANGNLDAARTLLREKGMAQAVKHQQRATTEGLVAHRLAGGRGTMIAIGCESEPVSKTHEFQAFAERVLDEVEANGPEALDALDQERQELSAKLRENVTLRGAARYTAEEGERIAAYVHPPRNQIGVLLRARGGTDELARQLAMHISFSAPRWTTRDEVTSDYAESERAIYQKLPEVASKPEAARAKIVEGMLNKRFYAASPGGVLLEQAWIYEDKKKVGQVLEEAGMEVVEFVRFSVSE